MNERLTAPLSLAAGALAVLVMAVWGMNSLTAPFKDDAANSSSTTCEASKARVLKRSDVTVSVYNAGKRQGRAGATLDLLEEAGFDAGAVGNAPKKVRVHTALVRTTQAVHPDATLVAKALGAKVRVVVTADDLGPGVDVIIGDGFRKLDRNAPRTIRQPATSC